MPLKTWKSWEVNNWVRRFQAKEHQQQRSQANMPGVPRWHSLLPVKPSSSAPFSGKVFGVLFSFLIVYLFIFREQGREEEREGEIHQCVVASCVPPTWGPGPQPRHVSWLGIEPVTLWFTGRRHSIHWATPPRAGKCFWFLQITITHSLDIVSVSSLGHHVHWKPSFQTQK